MGAENDDRVLRRVRSPDRPNSAEPEGGQSGHWTWRSALTRAADVLRGEGARRLLLRILAETVYRRMILLERLLDDPVTEVKPGLPVVVDLLKPSEVDEFMEFHPLAGPSEVSRRLEAGHLCFAARHEGRLVGASWVYTGQAWWVGYLACSMRLATDEAYLYHTYTSPSYRGQRISAARDAAQVRYLRNDGYRRVLALVPPWNKPSLRALEKAGWKPLGVMGYVKLGPWRRHFCRVTGGSSAPVVCSAPPASDPTPPRRT
jgi:GNAT superfamily N-acetyltransferase